MSVAWFENVVSLLSMANCYSESVINGSPMTNSDCVKFSIVNNSNIFSNMNFQNLTYCGGPEAEGGGPRCCVEAVHDLTVRKMMKSRWM